MKNALLVILILFWRFILLFPKKLLLILSEIIGRFLFILSLNRNKVSKTNIDLCFPNLESKKRYHIHKKNIINSGKIIFYTGVAWFWSDDRINKKINYEINGLEKILELQNKNIGVLLMFKHSLHLELDTRILGMNAPIYGIEREHNSLYFDKIQKNGRLKGLAGLADRKNTITFMKWLKKGKTVLYAPDQDYGLKNSIITDFFKLPAATISAPFKIQKKTDCECFFLNSYFRKGKLILDIETLNLNNSDIDDYLKNLNIFIEEKISKHPSEYLWQHRRFKSTLGKEKIYK